MKGNCHKTNFRRCKYEKQYSSVPVRLEDDSGLSFRAVLGHTIIFQFVQLFCNSAEEENVVKRRLERFWAGLCGRRVRVVAFTRVKLDANSQAMISVDTFHPLQMSFLWCFFRDASCHNDDRGLGEWRQV